jgi:DNA invertase Pin-like site-specific DNA recombinase
MSAPSPRIRADHLARRACVYIRQSTVFQVTHHRESTERQYHLRQRALALGWTAATIDIIDEDQGQSGTSAEHRHGFQRLAAEVAARQVGIVFMLEASRLARCGSDWHRLIEVCSVTQTLIADEMAVYDPREPNDRLLLGVKGTLSEAELFTLRTRLYEGRWNKARKGQLGRSVPTGYVLDAQGHWVKDPNLQVQERLSYVFALFRELGVARRVVQRLRAQQLKLPVCTGRGPGEGHLNWKAPGFGALMRVLHNPGYAGAYVYGQWAYEGTERDPKTGKAKARRRAPQDWPVCIQDHHEGYISWEEYLANRRRLRQNGYRSMTTGAPREGAALLQGLVWCGRCGAKMQVNTHAVREKRRPTYICCRDYSEGAGPICHAMTSKPIDELVVALFLDAMVPAQIDVAMKAVDKLRQEQQALQQQWEQQLSQARYEAQLAQRQYDAVDPDYRLVAAELERRWNEKLETLQALEGTYTQAQKQARFALSAEEEREVRQLAQDLPAVWHAPTTTDRERKELLRHAIAEVQLDGVTFPGKIDIRVTWRSGAVTRRQIERLKVGSWAPSTANEVIERIRALAAEHTVAEIVETLNREGFRSAHGRVFHEHHVRYLARRHHIVVTTSAKSLRAKGHSWRIPE